MKNSKVTLSVSGVGARVGQFTDELTALIRQPAVKTVEQAIETQGGPGPRRSGSRRATSQPPATRKQGKAKRLHSGRRRRRSPEEVEALNASLMDYVVANPGERLEEIGRGMNEGAAGLKRPAQLLLEDGELRIEG